MQGGHDVANDVVQAQQLWLADVAAAEGEELTGQVGGPLGGPLDLFDVVERRRPPRAGRLGGDGLLHEIDQATDS